MLKLFKFSKVLLLFIFQFLEKLAYTIILIQLPIYIAQKDAPSGLHWQQETKGLIFFIWALVQNSVPLFSGYLSDRISNKKIIQIGLFTSLLGFVGLMYSKSVFLFILSTILIGIGSGSFKPALQGALAFFYEIKHSQKIWPVYIIIINIAFFTAGYLSKKLKEINWTFVFAFSALITFVNFLLVSFFFPKLQFQHQNKLNALSSEELQKKVLQKTYKPKLILVLSVATCFMLIYMQFYESLPNFIYDWTDTSRIAEQLNLPKPMLTETPRGLQIGYEWLYSLNAILTIMFILLVTSILKKIPKTMSLSLGLFFTTSGLVLCGFFIDGSYLLVGIIIYTLGEMIVNPKLLEFISDISPIDKKSHYFGLLNISSLIGLCVGAISGGYFYKHIAEKSTLALKYLNLNFHQFATATNITNPLNELANLTRLSPPELTLLLWETFNPYFFWVPFISFGILGIILSFLLNRNNTKNF
ncbi:MAG: MFS transporter [Candidatus Kapaibacteriales bacterium]